MEGFFATVLSVVRTVGGLARARFFHTKITLNGYGHHKNVCVYENILYLLENYYFRKGPRSRCNLAGVSVELFALQFVELI